MTDKQLAEQEARELAEQRAPRFDVTNQQERKS